MKMLDSLDYVAASTFFKQRYRGGGATHIDASNNSKRAQLDYVLCKASQLSIVKSIRNDWSPTAWKFGKYSDHCMQVVKVQRSIKRRPKQATDRRQWADWMHDEEVVRQMTKR
eukprot:COSAG06_NODE_2885_length_6133_cov_190.874544_2_plen_113_part_00